MPDETHVERSTGSADVQDDPRQAIASYGKLRYHFLILLEDGRIKLCCASDCGLD